MQQPPCTVSKNGWVWGGVGRLGYTEQVPRHRDSQSTGRRLQAGRKNITKRNSGQTTANAGQISEFLCSCKCVCVCVCVGQYPASVHLWMGHE